MPVGAIVGAVGGIGSALLSKPKAQKDPSAYLRPYMNSAAQQAQGLFAQGGPQVYSGSTVAGMSDPTQMALQAQLARAQGGSPLIGQAQQFTQQNLGQPIASNFGAQQNPYGSPVTTGGANPFASGANPFGGDTNPYLDSMFNQAAQRSRSTLESEFAGSGRNIEAAAPARADMLTDLAAKVYAPAYESERNRQLSYGQQQLGIGANSFEAGQDRSLQSGLAAQQIGAQGYENAQNRQLSDLTSQRGFQSSLAGMAPTLANQDYLDIAQQRDAGNAYDQHSQAQLTDQVNQFNQQQQRPYQNLQQLIASLSGLAGGTAQYPQQAPQPNYAAAGLGGAILGQQLYAPQGQAPMTTPPYVSNYGGLTP